MNDKFTFLGPSHITMLLLTLFLTAGFIWAGRKWPDTKLSRILGAIPATCLLGSYIAYNIQRVLDGYWEPRYDLPMELCTWAAIAVIITGFTKNQFTFELTYFWVMAGSIHGTLTPNLQEDFPHFYFFIYFIGHVGLIVASFYFLFAWKLRPTKGSVLRVFLMSELYFVVALSLDFLLDTNYGYLRHKPTNPSFMDYLGPWPYYLIWMQLLAFPMFLLLYLPFYIRDKFAFPENRKRRITAL